MAASLFNISSTFDVKAFFEDAIVPSTEQKTDKVSLVSQQSLPGQKGVPSVRLSGKGTEGQADAEVKVKKVSKKRKREEVEEHKEAKARAKKSRIKDPSFNPPPKDPKNKTFLNLDDILTGPRQRKAVNFKEPSSDEIDEMEFNLHVEPEPIQTKPLPMYVMSADSDFEEEEIIDIVKYRAQKKLEEDAKFLADLVVVEDGLVPKEKAPEKEAKKVEETETMADYMQKFYPYKFADFDYSKLDAGSIGFNPYL